MTVAETYKTDPGQGRSGRRRRCAASTSAPASLAGIVLAFVAHRVAQSPRGGPRAPGRRPSDGDHGRLGDRLHGRDRRLHGPVPLDDRADLTHADELFLAGKDQGIGRYFRFTTDHKVVGIQYLVLTMVMLGVGGTWPC